MQLSEVDSKGSLGIARNVEVPRLDSLEAFGGAIGDEPPCALSPQRHPRETTVAQAEQDTLSLDLGIERWKRSSVALGNL